MTDLYVPVLLGTGLLILLVSWLPLVLRRAPLSLPIVCVAIGWAVAKLTPLGALLPDPLEAPFAIEKLAEMVVIVSLMGAGLKIGRPIGLRSWGLTWRLLGIAMPLTILALVLLAQGVLGVGLATALLIGAVLAPTDPVLAADVQIEDPTSDQDDEARFALTSEAGLNDSAAFPFVHLAILAAGAGLSAATLPGWAADAVAARIGIGLMAGYAVGRLLGWVIYHLPNRTQLSRTGDGFVALGGTFVAYAGVELVHGYGFVAVFVAALAVRRHAEGHDYNETLHDFADAVERLLMMVLLVAFGALIGARGLFDPLGWADLAFAVAALLVVRPVAAWLSLIGSGKPAGERAVIAAFGIRGLGSIYYLAYALNHARFEAPEKLWGLVGLVVLLSILAHGVTVTPAMRWLERRRGAQRA